MAYFDSSDFDSSEGAVSRQVSALEEQVGLELFKRLHHQRVLTDAGQSYLGKVRAGLNLLARGTLVEPFPQTVMPRQGHCLCYPAREETVAGDGAGGAVDHWRPDAHGYRANKAWLL